MTKKTVSFKRSEVDGPPDGEAWIWHTSTLMTSMAWQRRSDDLRILLEFLEVEHIQHAGLENGNLLAPYDDLVKAGVRRANIARAIKEGEALKLLVATRQGRDFGTGKRQPTRFRLTYLPTRKAATTDERREEWHAATDDWKRYRPPENGSKKSKTRFRRRNPAGTASGTRARRYFEENSHKPSTASGT